MASFHLAHITVGGQRLALRLGNGFRMALMYVGASSISNYLPSRYQWFSLVVNSAIASSDGGLDLSVVLLELNLALSAGGNILDPNFDAHLELRANSGAVLLYSWDLSAFFRAQ